MFMQKRVWIILAIIVVIMSICILSYFALDDMDAGRLKNCLVSIFGGGTLFSIIMILQQKNQNFRQEFSNRLDRLLSVKSSLSVSGKIIDESAMPKDIYLSGEDVFKLMYWQFYYLSKALVGERYEWEEDRSRYDDFISNFDEVEMHFNPELYEEKQKERLENLKTRFVLYDFGKQGYVQIRWKEAYNLVVKRWSTLVTPYYKQLLEMLSYLNQHTCWYISKTEKECIRQLVASMTTFEQTMLFYYFVTHRGKYCALERYKDILFKNIDHLLSESHLALSY